MLDKKRNTAIDMLRGLAMILIVLIHANAYFLKDNLAHWLWNTSQLSVAVFIFCSAYVYFVKTKSNGLVTVQNFLPYLKKRLYRLFYDYYIFLIPYLLLICFTETKKLTPFFILQNLTVTGGIDLNWLVLLFVYFSFLMPLIDYLATKNHRLFLLFTFFSYLSAVYLLFFPSPTAYRLDMWLPWALTIIFTWYIVHYEQNKKNLYGLLTFSFFLFLTTLIIQLLFHHSLDFYRNKYPPNLYYISYGLWTMIALYLVAQKGIFEKITIVSRFLNFMSVHSYSLFFIHFFYIFAFQAFHIIWYFNWWSLFLVVLMISFITQFAFDKISFWKHG